MSSSSFVGLTTGFGGAKRGASWKPASTGIHGKATSGAAHADRMRLMRVMYGVGGDPEARFPRKLAHTGGGAGVQERWNGGRFDFLDPALRSALTEWPQFDEVDELLRSRAKRRVEIDFLRNRMEQTRAPFADRSQEGVEVLEYFSLGGHAFACVVMEELPREPGVCQFVRTFYVEALNSEDAAAFAHEQKMQAQAITDQRHQVEQQRQREEAESAYMAQIDREEKEREERLMAEEHARLEMEKMRLQAEATAPPDLHGIKGRVRMVVAERFGDGMKGIKRFFDSVDTNRRGKWSLRDMMDGLRDYGIPYTEKEVHAFYNYLDVDRLQTVSFDSFYIFVKGELSPSRMAMVASCFDNIDVGRHGVVPIDELPRYFDASMHVDVMNGKMSEDQCTAQMLQHFSKRAARPGLVTQAEFAEYYGSLYYHVDDDAHFALMLKRAWPGEKV